MKYIEFRNLLLEYDKKKIQSLQNLLDQRLQDTSDNDRSLPVTDNIIDLANSIEELGVRSGEEIFWLLHRYVSATQGRYGINRWEDIRARAIPALKQFADLKKKTTLAPPLHTRDLNQIKTLSDLENILQTYQEKTVTSKKAQQKAEEQGFFDRNEAELIYDDAEIKVTSPKTHAASCYFGKNTKWCTTSRDDEDTFLDYIQDGPLYIILIKKLNRRFQFHFETDQFMNERDDPIDPRELAEEYPVLWQIFGYKIG
jgi:hypothetical protein